MKDYDMFAFQKEEGYQKSLQSIESLATYLMDVLEKASCVSTNDKKEELCKILKLNLWGNK